MDILMFETCWANISEIKTTSDIKLVFNSSTIDFILFEWFSATVWSRDDVWMNVKPYIDCNLLTKIFIYKNPLRRHLPNQDILSTYNETLRFNIILTAPAIWMQSTAQYPASLTSTLTWWGRWSRGNKMDTHSQGSEFGPWADYLRLSPQTTLEHSPFTQQFCEC